ncbi:mannose-1-phosphate guanylyltransferase/mannose-6-phosphate isomerase [Kerstersia gyiorum]|uniref:mannose-1-phosphate guanylyltransferase/mannose-6-phosphate isomerase n=1 Tax=Kerstersia gyiorum TaxID=206506 RepID=UPI00242F27B3|nr:mannose-1-phosphate guanylyltransferase/mannose-6-phosphate isomerase [Kerstersia gyiorum]
MHSATNIIPVILCGGSGTRLWPMSRQSLPKQFIPLADGKSLLQLTLARAQALGAATCVGITAEDHRFLVDSSMREHSMARSIILEPVARNTAAAICLASLNTSASDVLVIMPADHYIPDTALFVQAMQHGINAARDGHMVAFGVHPAFPSTAYGYLTTESGTEKTQSRQVLRFREKPRRDEAQEIILKGNSYWNSGIYVSQAGVLLDAFAEYAPDILQACRQAMNSASLDGVFVRPDTDAFTACRSESVDYAVMEHAHNLRLVPFHGSWSDVGSWNSAAELLPADEQGNRVSGNGRAVNSSNTQIRSSNRLVVALGTRDISIIETPDAILVTANDMAEQVKDIVNVLKTEDIPEALTHRKIFRPWGWYDVIDQSDKFLVKRIAVHPGASLSLQKHNHRAEHWIVVKGTAEVTRNDERFPLQANESTYIPIGAIHRLHNPGTEDLEMVEIQTGDYLDESDIIRFEDSYGRQ